MKQIIKTDNPDILIERSVIDKEINIKDLEKEILELKNQLNQFNMLEINEDYPDEITTTDTHKSIEIGHKNWWCQD